MTLFIVLRIQNDRIYTIRCYIVSKMVVGPNNHIILAVEFLVIKGKIVLP